MRSVFQRQLLELNLNVERKLNPEHVLLISFEGMRLLDVGCGTGALPAWIFSNVREAKS
jgi:2-polyprenyl-3-methyl-5-hydroxy-6-metoxy-1,4-benzoquinol methylase